MTQEEIKSGVWVIPKQFLYNAYDEDDLQMVADAAVKAERERFCSLLRQVHDSISLASDPVGFQKRGEAKQAEQEPVAWYDKEHDETETVWSRCRPPWEGDWKPLYTAPPQREWVSLTDDEINKISHAIANAMPAGMTIEDWKRSFARAIEAKLKDRNS